MHASLLLLLAIPAVLLLAAFATAGAGVIRALWRRQVPSVAAFLALFGGLLLIDGVLSLLVVLNAALSHSERAKHTSPWYCLAIFLLIVALPAVTITLRIRSIRASNRAASSTPT